MTSFPDHPDLAQLRKQAKDLKRGLAEGDDAARRRVLASHPKFAGRPPERLDDWQFTLRDAQATVARENGFESWTELLTVFDQGEVVRWVSGQRPTAFYRAFDEAGKLGHRHCMGEHILLALLSPPEATVASQLLVEMGLSYETVFERASKMLAALQSDDENIRSTPVFQILHGLSMGIALGLNSRQITDEHILLAIVYGDPSGDASLIGFDLDVDEVVEGLRAHGVPVPPFAPPHPPPARGPFGSFIYFREGDYAAVTEIMTKRYPRTGSLWWILHSKSKPGYCCLTGEDVIPLEEVVRNAVTDPDLVEVVSTELGAAREWPKRSTSDTRTA